METGVKEWDALTLSSRQTVCVGRKMEGEDAVPLCKQGKPVPSVFGFGDGFHSEL